MFGLFKKEKSDVFTAPVTGQLMPLDALNDGVFSEKMMGEGYAVAQKNKRFMLRLLGRSVRFSRQNMRLGLHPMRDLKC